MNLKVANLVAVQFGVLVGIMSWLAYSRFESAEPRIAAVEMRKRPVDSVAAVAPISDLGSQVTRALDSGTDREQDQSTAEPPVPVVPPHHQYSPEAVQQYTALAAQQYYQQIAPRRYASASLENRLIAAVAPVYTEVAREPAAISLDYVEPVQTVAYTEPYPVVVYPQPQFVVFFNARRFANRCRPTAPLRDAHMPIAHRRPDRAECHPNGHTIVSPQNAGVKPCRPNQGLMAQGKR